MAVMLAWGHADALLAWNDAPGVSLAFLLLVMIGALAITGVARGGRVQPALVIVVVASAVSFIPGLPRLQLPPGLILGVVVPPLLYWAAYGVSLSQFLRNLRPILALGVTLVLVTTGLIGLLTHLLLPALGLAGAFLLAAIASPPDTATAVSHGRALGLTRRVQNILTGESLVNDAMALTLFALALNAISPAHVLTGNLFLLFAYQAVMGLLVGLVLSTVGILVRLRMRQPTLETATGFILPFAAYLSAELLHASGILAVVATAFVVSGNTMFDRRWMHPLTHRTRLREREFWPVVNALLESFVFAYMGLQLRFVLDDLRASGEAFWGTLGAGLLILLALMALRLVWAYLSFHPRLTAWVYAQRLAQLERKLARHPELAARRPEWKARQAALAQSDLSWQENVLIGWTGMRGIITLAAAAGVPLTLESGAPFPGRAVIQTVAFVVTLGTLLLQGASLPWLSRRLHIDLSQDDADGEAALRAATAVAAGPPAHDFDARRQTLFDGLQRGEVDEAAARTLILQLDLAQAAQESTAEEAEGA